MPARTVSTPVGTPFDRKGSRSKNQSVSLQRRALLLPQEVKELGTEEAIVFYEGLRPIRCRKIRYFSDRRFRSRLLPAPPVPGPPRRGPPPAVARTQSLQASAPGEAISSYETIRTPPPKKEDEVVREATMKEIERIDSLTLEDFATDFSKVQIPEKDGPLSETEMDLAVDSFLGALER